MRFEYDIKSYCSIDRHCERWLLLQVFILVLIRTASGNPVVLSTLFVEWLTSTVISATTSYYLLRRICRWMLLLYTMCSTFALKVGRHCCMTHCFLLRLPSRTCPMYQTWVWQNRDRLYHWSLWLIEMAAPINRATLRACGPAQRDFPWWTPSVRKCVAWQTRE